MPTNVKDKTSDSFRVDNIQTSAVYHSDPINLPLDKSLPSPVLYELEHFSAGLNLIVQVPNISFPVNVYLYLDGNKYDLYFNVTAGKYSFRLLPIKKKLKIDIFFTAGFRKSSSLLVEQI